MLCIELMFQLLRAIRKLYEVLEASDHQVAL